MWQSQPVSRHLMKMGLGQWVGAGQSRTVQQNLIGTQYVFTQVLHGAIHISILFPTMVLEIDTEKICLVRVSMQLHSVACGTR